MVILIGMAGFFVCLFHVDVVVFLLVSMTKLDAQEMKNKGIE